MNYYFGYTQFGSSEVSCRPSRDSAYTELFRVHSNVLFGSFGEGRLFLLLHHRHYPLVRILDKFGFYAELLVRFELYPAFGPQSDILRLVSCRR